MPNPVYCFSSPVPLLISILPPWPAYRLLYPLNNGRLLFFLVFLVDAQDLANQPARLRDRTFALGCQLLLNQLPPPPFFAQIVFIDLAIGYSPSPPSSIFSCGVC